MATTNAKPVLSGLARRLVLDELISETAASKSVEAAARNKVPLVAQLVEDGVSARDIALSASHEFGVPLFDLGVMDIEQAPIKDIKEELIRKHHALPLFRRGSVLHVGVSDPTNLLALDEFRFAANAMGISQTQAVLVEEDKLGQVIEKALDDGADLGDLSDDEGLEDLEVTDGNEAPTDEDDDSSNVDEAPIVRYVNKILLDAIKKGASDLHFEPYEKFYRVRFRIDGLLQEVAKPPLAMANRLASRIKVMSRLDLAERRVPQDGRIKLKLSKNKAIDFRVSTCPTLFGEKVVMRILDPSSAKLGIDALGYEEEQKRLFLENIQKPYGMVLVTGPTGSGKTVSLYTAVNILNDESTNISTAEDPVEINLPGVNQVQIDERTGMDFSKALKAFLRQDPDVILVGEIRDLETGGIAIKAAMTGHMVLATLHTNDAPQTINRMVDMGIPPFNIASAVSLVIAQRLARRLCTKCKVEADIPKEALLEEGFSEAEIKQGITLYKANEDGCSGCTRGYKGRVGIYQVMSISEDMKRVIMEGGNSLDIAAQAEKEGIPDLRKSGLKKARDGITSLEEINRVTKED